MKHINFFNLKNKVFKCSIERKEIKTRAVKVLACSLFCGFFGVLGGSALLFLLGVPLERVTSNGLTYGSLYVFLLPVIFGVLSLVILFINKKNVGEQK